MRKKQLAISIQHSANNDLALILKLKLTKRD